ncbi:hypothetical protein NQ317_011639 [Molorchus minor]|uniref:C2H2-type domain-containing protein n=1 Tax=Molorchus minor TaxID=1323400 RepID=A0ABQ9JBE5_9CUCU|nr:hypothetical protein NQ317_011639 [Molorchus minor]
MGSLSTFSFSCPLCCDEKFTSHSSLRYHILSIIDNLLCTACGLRFENMLALAEHLGRECQEKEDEPEISSENIKKRGDTG